MIGPVGGRAAILVTGVTGSSPLPTGCPRDRTQDADSQVGPVLPSTLVPPSVFFACVCILRPFASSRGSRIRVSFAVASHGQGCALSSPHSISASLRSLAVSTGAGNASGRIPRAPLPKAHFYH